MSQRSRLLIYERKEVVLLAVLSLLVALFAFTFGVHLGKRVPPKVKPLSQNEAEVGSVRQISDQAPTRAEAQDKVSDAPAVVSKTLDESLKEEVAASGIQLEKPIQVELPRKTLSEKKGHKTEGSGSPESTHAQDAHQASAAPTAGGLASALKRAAPEGTFTVQILAAPVNETDRLDRVMGELVKAGLQPWVRRVELPGKGSWYRIYNGGFSSPELAEKAASSLKSSGKIQGYVVVKIPAGVGKQASDSGTGSRSGNAEDHPTVNGELDE